MRPTMAKNQYNKADLKYFRIDLKEISPNKYSVCSKIDGMLWYKTKYKAKASIKSKDLNEKIMIIRSKI